MKRKALPVAIAPTLPLLPNYRAVEHLESTYRACWFSIWDGGEPINETLAAMVKAGRA